MENILKTLVKEREVYRLSGKEAGKLTKECLKKALVELMGEKAFDKITISELVLKSGVSRQSFYRNYNSKEEILKDLHEEIANAILSITDQSEKKDSYTWFTVFFTYLKKNAEYLSMLFKAVKHQQSGFSFLPPVKELFRIEDREEQYRVCAYEGGLNSICMEWITGGMKESVEDMAHLCDSIFGKIHDRLHERRILPA